MHVLYLWFAVKSSPLILQGVSDNPYESSSSSQGEYGIITSLTTNSSVRILSVNIMVSSLLTTPSLAAALPLITPKFPAKSTTTSMPPGKLIKNTYLRHEIIQKALIIFHNKLLPKTKKVRQLANRLPTVAFQGVLFLMIKR